MGYNYHVAYCFEEGGAVYEDVVGYDELQSMKEDGEFIILNVETTSDARTR